MLSAADVDIPEVIRYFTRRGIEATFLVPTETGLKSIMDATAPVRVFLKQAGIHDFDEQPHGGKSTNGWFLPGSSPTPGSTARKPASIDP
ncbi:hypothetical protein H1235_12650 [Pseudoxanthomonas sp. NC8]|nr:hypothetical protein H1235_12650 [Pseudoxanthomonas sp. NC8]